MCDATEDAWLLSTLFLVLIHICEDNSHCGEYLGKAGGTSVVSS